jgi:XTP/dITP diphosphohydrolase
MKTKIIIATNNSGKAREFNAMLGSLFEVVSQKDMNVKEVPETGLTFVENALIKARNASKQSGLPAIADDSGIVVDALNGEPGIYSARYSGKHGNDEENTQKLLTAMRNVPDSKRAARFWCSIVYVNHAKDPTPIIVQRGWEGEILRDTAGENGFGYDPIFYVPTHGCTSAELDPAEKNKISHRGRALQELILALTIKY